MTRPYQRRRTMVSRGNAPTRRPWENEHEWVGKPTRKLHRGKLNYFADCLSRNPVASERDTEDENDWDGEIRSEVSAVFQSKLHPLTSITFELVEAMSKDDEAIQRIMRQLREGLPED